jgi:signal transduction histidine kinase/ligand-binding sensor domain-containing protein/DNA-binding response OmpR family regulator
MKLLYLFFSALIFSTSIIAQPQNARFEKLTADDGLSNNRTRALLYDHKGFMWIGTIGGLNRYDGYKFTTYKTIQGDSGSLSENDIRVLYEDRSGHLWIGTESGGFCSFNPETNNFTRYYKSQGDSSGLISNFVTSFGESVYNNKQYLWIGTNYGLNRYDPESKTYSRYFPEGTQKKYSANQNFIGAIARDSTSRLWVGTWKEGLFYFDPAMDQLVPYIPKPEYLDFNINMIWKIYAVRENGRDILWITTSNAGLFRIDLNSGEIRNYLHNKNLSTSDIMDVYPEKKSGGKRLWVATHNGLFRLDTETGDYTHYKNNPKNPRSLSSNNVYSVIEDNSGVIWVATSSGLNMFKPRSANISTLEYSLVNTKVNAVTEIEINGHRVLWIGTLGGLSRYDRDNRQFKHFVHDPQNSYSLSSNEVFSIHPSINKKFLWLGTFNGLNRVDLRSTTIKRFYISGDDSATANTIYSVCEDDKGLIWVGSHNGLLSFNPYTEKFTRNGLARVYALYFDSHNILWIGTTSGLKKWDLKSGESDWYTHDPNDPNSVNHDIMAIHEDNNHNIWIGTLAGLYFFNRVNGILRPFQGKNGFTFEEIWGIQEDNTSNLWLSTATKIFKFNPQSMEYKSYDSDDGFLSNQFDRAVHKNADGEMFFGGYGLNIFHPDKIKENTVIPGVVITDLRIFNESVIPGQTSVLKNQIYNTDNIELSYDQTVFSLEFAALDYQSQGRNSYSYILEGFDPKWIDTDASLRLATYTNLDPGEYTFRVKASNNDGYWNEEGASLKIIINPPPWATWWAYSLYFVFFLSLVYFLRRYELNRLYLKHETRKLQEMDSLKSKFFAGISHEFRTPLTLILGPAERLIQKIKDKTQTDDLKRIRDNARRMNKLVDMYLDLSMLERGSLSIRKSNTDIIQILRTLIASFESMVADKKISLQFINNFDSVICAIDKEKFEQIIINLLNNAIKFTPGQGEIQIRLMPGESKNNILIMISDTGIGIAADQKDKIFEMFYQVDNDINQRLIGTGIGLAMVKELVKLHDAEIIVQSEFGHGTEIQLLFPVIEIIDGKTKNTSEDSLSQEQASEEAYIEKMESDETVRILIVEDNHEMRKYIKCLIEDKFKVESCVDGSEGINRAVEFLPDLIVSDVMMPNMGGYEFVDKIKNDLRTSHVPIILLTAKTKKPDKLKGLKTGADAYITKPFDSSELYICIDNLLENRKRIHQKFKQDKFFNASEVDITSADEKFLQLCHQAVEENMANPDFTMENFASQVNLSRTQLHKKLKSLTGNSATAYVRTLRLKKAAILLESGFGNITEIAYETGFSNPSYFTECFRKFYKTSPVKYLKTLKVNISDRI